MGRRTMLERMNRNSARTRRVNEIISDARSLVSDIVCSLEEEDYRQAELTVDLADNKLRLLGHYLESMNKEVDQLGNAFRIKCNLLNVASLRISLALAERDRARAEVRDLKQEILRLHVEGLPAPLLPEEVSS